MRRRLVLAAIALLLCACSRLTLANYDKLKVGMTFDEVKAILGDPERCDDAMGFRACRFGDEKRHVDVKFVGEKAVLFDSENLR
ncbi:MAG TPA: hypothetical protein VMW35_17145 [Myxococcota bacterium]|jgi:hypothetical protein|nr:hypothetical protein [Myxococcota bacterium]